MDKLDFNISLAVFMLGAVLFFVVPMGSFSAAFTNDLYLLALCLESTGVVTALIVYFRDDIARLEL